MSHFANLERRKLPSPPQTIDDFSWKYLQVKFYIKAHNEGGNLRSLFLENL